MGRTVGATAAGTQERLLRAAADVFARRGYEGARVSDIAAEAELSNGALYSYFGSKAELLVGALRAHGHRLLKDLVDADPARPLAELLLVTGRSLRRRRDPDGDLVIAALVAARRDADVAAQLRTDIGERAGTLVGLIRRAQARGELDRSLPPEAVAHFCLSLAVGTALVPPDLHDVDEEEWGTFLARLVAALAPPTPDQTGCPC